MLGGLGIDTAGPEEQVEVLVEALGYGVEAASAGHFKVRLVAGAEANVVDELVSSVILSEEVGATVDWHGGHLDDAGTVVDGAGGDRLTELNRFPFQLEYRYQ